MEMDFPWGRDGAVSIRGTARDLFTRDPADQPEILAADQLRARVNRHKIIESIETIPALPDIDALAGASAIIGFRNRLRPLLDAPALASRPLMLLLDDMVGSNIISTWVWTKWIRNRDELIAWVGDVRPMENACIGYRPGSSGLASHDYFDRIDYVPPLGCADDPHAFHALEPDRDKTMRRVRRIDIWREGDAIAIDAMFQDSGILPGRRRSAVHEYRLRARADAATGILVEIEALPGVLPHPECLNAPGTIQSLMGQPLTELRAKVLLQLRGPAGCTHLNDATRALAEVPLLAVQLA